jgi:predicted HicB family RNase H-like nuclease
MDSSVKKYAMLQIDAEVHQMLKDFCKEKGYKMNGLVETLIKERVSSIKISPTNVLRPKT